MIKINGVAIPAPTDFQVGIQDLSKAERNARGKMIIERIATKIKLEFEWEYLTKAEYQQILNLVSPVFFKVEYPDPKTGTQQTKIFYAGDRLIGGLDYSKGQMRWKNCKFNVIEE